MFIASCWSPYNQTMETSSLPIFVYISSELNYICNIMKSIWKWTFIKSFKPHLQLIKFVENPVMLPLPHPSHIWDRHNPSSNNLVASHDPAKQQRWFGGVGNGSRKGKLCNATFLWLRFIFWIHDSAICILLSTSSSSSSPPSSTAEGTNCLHENLYV